MWRTQSFARPWTRASTRTCPAAEVCKAAQLGFASCLCLMQTQTPASQRRTADAPSPRRREPSEYVRVLNTNTVGSFRVTQALYPLLMKRQTRTVVNVSSGAGSIAVNRAGLKDLTGKIVAYASSKAALNMRAPHRPAPGSGRASAKAALGMHASERCLAPMRPTSCNRLWHQVHGSGCLRQSRCVRRRLAGCAAAARPAAPC